MCLVIFFKRQYGSPTCRSKNLIWINILQRLFMFLIAHFFDAMLCSIFVNLVSIDALCFFAETSGENSMAPNFGIVQSEFPTKWWTHNIVWSCEGIRTQPKGTKTQSCMPALEKKYLNISKIFEYRNWFQQTFEQVILEDIKLGLWQTTE